MARILIVDDTKEIRTLVNHILTEAGHEVLTAGDAMEAMEMLNSYRVDLLLLDIEMPYTNGLQFSETLRASLRYKLLPIIFLTARREKNDLERAVKVQIENYLLKPIDRQRLLVAVNAVISKTQPQEHLKCNVVDTTLSDRAYAMRKTSIKLISISEVGATVHSNQAFENEEIVNLDTSFFQQAEIPNLPLKVASQKQLGPFNWEIHLAFCNLNQGLIVKIRNWLISQQQKKPA